MPATPFPLRALVLAVLALVPLFQGGCEGTSSGVDNPSLTVSFRDDAGTAARVTGDLNVYDLDQNPALDPQPLWTVQVRNSALATLTGTDFDRILSAAGKRAAAKISASARTATSEIVPQEFNLAFQGQSLTGDVAFNFRYDGSAFYRIGDGKVDGLDMHPKTLVRYQARLSRTGLGLDGVTRVFIPGTEFSATLTDSGFTFEGLPQGDFPLRVLAQDGRILAVKESLDTRTSREFTCDPHPIDSVPPLVAPEPVFTVDAGGRREALLETPTVLEAKVAGVDPKDARLHFLWTFLPDTIGQHVGIKTPTSLISTVQLMSGEGTYSFEISVTLGTKTVRDTLQFVATRPAIPRPRIVRPAPDEIVPTGKPYKVQWQLPTRGAVEISLQIAPGGDWRVLVGDFKTADSVQVYPWTPPLELSGDTCKIQVRSLQDSAIAVSEKPFILH
jgi:hypothetical protein